MQKPISRMQHGIADWLLVPAVAAAPYLFGFADVIIARNLAWICAGIVLLSVILTRAEWGLIRVVPYKIHLLTDAGIGLLTLTAPVLFGFTGVPAARNTFVILGTLVVVASTILSRPEEMPRGHVPVTPLHS